MSGGEISSTAVHQGAGISRFIGTGTDERKVYGEKGVYTEGAEQGQLAARKK